LEPQRAGASEYPVGVAEHKITKSLPKKYQAELPTPKELREQLRKAAPFYRGVVLTKTEAAMNDLNLLSMG
jgi:hypothetical protein